MVSRYIDKLPSGSFKLHSRKLQKLTSLQWFLLKSTRIKFTGISTTLIFPFQWEISVSAAMIKLLFLKLSLMAKSSKKKVVLCTLFSHIKDLNKNKELQAVQNNPGSKGNLWITFQAAPNGFTGESKKFSFLMTPGRIHMLQWESLKKI